MIEMDVEQSLVVKVPQANVRDFASLCNKIDNYLTQSGYFKKLYLSSGEKQIVSSLNSVLNPPKDGQPNITHHVSDQYSPQDITE